MRCLWLAVPNHLHHLLAHPQHRPPRPNRFLYLYDSSRSTSPSRMPRLSPWYMPAPAVIGIVVLSRALMQLTRTFPRPPNPRPPSASDYRRRLHSSSHRPNLRIETPAKHRRRRHAKAPGPLSQPRRPARPESLQRNARATSATIPIAISSTGPAWLPPKSSNSAAKNTSVLSPSSPI